MKRKQPDRKMPSILKTDAERARAKSAGLTKQYRAIGPAAVAAALLFMRKKKTAPKPA